MRQMLPVRFGFGASLPSNLREEEKMILVASPDHSGSKLPAFAAVRAVRGVRPEPSAFVRQMLEVLLLLGASLPSSLRDEAKTIFEPSGDHRGS